jgi:predicted RNA-binding Zn ribbon-like protein
MGFGADQLEALVECVELVNTGRAVSGVPVGASSGGQRGQASDDQRGQASDDQRGLASDGQRGQASDGRRGQASGGQRGLASGGQRGLAWRLASLEDVIAFGRRHRVENLTAARASDVPRLLELRSRLDAVVVACQIGDETTAISDLNALLAETGAVPQIVTHDGRLPHIHVTRAAAPLADRIAAHSAMGLAELIVAGQSGRLRTCASPACDAVFIDLSRNQSRRYCDSRTCGNRVHVAAYRSRRSASSRPGAGRPAERLGGR